MMPRGYNYIEEHASSFQKLGGANYGFIKFSCCANRWYQPSAAQQQHLLIVIFGTDQSCNKEEIILVATWS